MNNQTGSSAIRWLASEFHHRRITFLKLARKAPQYQIQHASGRLTVVSAALWAEHVQIGNLIRLARRKAMVAKHLACCEVDGRLVFQERNEDGFSGDHPIGSQWAAVMRAWLLKGPFADPVDFEYFIKECGRTRPEAYIAWLALQ